MSLHLSLSLSTSLFTSLSILLRVCFSFCWPLFPFILLFCLCFFYSYSIFTLYLCHQKTNGRMKAPPLFPPYKRHGSLAAKMVLSKTQARSDMVAKMDSVVTMAVGAFGPKALWSWVSNICRHLNETCKRIKVVKLWAVKVCEAYVEDHKVTGNTGEVSHVLGLSLCALRWGYRTHVYCTLVHLW